MIKSWDDYLYWQAHDQKKVKRINKLIKDIERNGHNGTGKPEMLVEDLSGYCSRRIDDCNRIVYRVREIGLR